MFNSLKFYNLFCCGVMICGIAVAVSVYMCQLLEL
jgi:hypothetical protein